jgi:hypothetical protein
MAIFLKRNFSIMVIMRCCAASAAPVLDNKTKKRTRKAGYLREESKR